MKIRRNDPCPCGSGKKFKHCCRPWHQGERQQPAGPSPQLSLADTVAAIQEAATARKKAFRQLGVFVLFSTEEGDAWVLEATDRDGVQVAAKGERLPFLLDETSEVITIDWSHTFVIKDRRLVLTGYEDGAVLIPGDAPVQQIHAAVRRIMKRCTPELLSQVHIS